MSELASQFGNAAVVLLKEVSDAGTVTLGPLDVQAYDRVAFYIENTSAGGTAVASGKIESAPVTAGPWIEVQDLAAVMPIDGGVTKFIQFSSKSWKYIRLHLTADAADLPKINAWMSVGGAL